MNQQRVATDISINYDPSGKGGGQQEQAKGSSATESTWSPALTDFNEVLVGLGQKPLDTASLKLPALAAYYPETVTPSSTASTAESASTTPRILFWYHPDYLGNVDLVTERDGYAHEFFMYNPWGEEMHQWNANTYAFTSPYRFNSKELDPETGLAYYGARYYQNKLGVWLSVDPKAHWYPTMSAYNFVVNNPLHNIDPNGMWIEGAGLYRNVMNSDEKILAEDLVAKNKGALVKKFDNGYQVSYNLNDGYKATDGESSQISTTMVVFFSNKVKRDSQGKILSNGKSVGQGPTNFNLSKLGTEILRGSINSPKIVISAVVTPISAALHNSIYSNSDNRWSANPLYFGSDWKIRRIPNGYEGNKMVLKATIGTLFTAMPAPFFTREWVAKQTAKEAALLGVDLTI
jgi:RHS repeat-associated protein